MTEHQTGAPASSAASAYLTPMAAAISGFTLAVFSLFGNGAWVFPVQVFATSDSFPGDFDNVVIVCGVVQALLAAGGLALSRRVLATAEAGDGARHLAGAAGLVGAVGMLVAVATVVSGIVN
jgi:hypothetical protein